MRLPLTVTGPAAERLRWAMRLAGDLELKMQVWWAQEPVRLVARPGERSSQVQIVVATDPLPPLADWWRAAADIFNNLRSALDQFHHEVWVHLMRSEPGRGAFFPITKDEREWKSWAKSHKGFPPEITARYRSFQPWVSTRPQLRVLSEIKRAENHRRSLVPGLELTELNTGMLQMRVAPMLLPREFEEHTNVTLESVTTLDAPERVLATLTTLGHVELQSTQVNGRFEFSPYFEAAGEHVPWTGGISQIAHEVTWAMAHIAGTEPQATQPPTHFVLDA